MNRPIYISSLPTFGLRHFAAARNAAQLPFPLCAESKTFYYLARNAIYHLFRGLRLEPDQTVLAPDYHSGNEVAAIRAAGVKLRFYPIRRNLQPDLAAIEALCTPETRVLYVIHFAGWPQPMEPLARFCRSRGLLLVEDCALALLSALGEQPLGSFGDYAIYCLYKTLPVPNGGMLVQNRAPFLPAGEAQLRRPDRLSVAGRAMEVALESFRARFPDLGGALSACKAATGRALSAASVERAATGDIGFDLDRVNLSAAPLVRRLLPRFDYTAIKLRRRRNYEWLRARLEGRVNLVTAGLGDGICPLFLPILAEDKHAVAEHLWRKGIGAIQMWNQGDAEATGPDCADALFLRRHLLEIPIHQDMSERHLDHVAREVERHAPFSDRLEADVRPVSTGPSGLGL